MRLCFSAQKRTVGLVLGSARDVLAVAVGAVGDEVRRRVVVLGSVEAGLDDLLALPQRDHRLQLGRGEGVHVARLARDQHQCLGAGQSCELVRLMGERVQSMHYVERFERAAPSSRAAKMKY